MSDLISRSDVLDLLYGIFDKYKMCTDKNTSIGKGFGTDVFEEIRNMPTAYSVGKVVEGLNKLDVKAIKRYKGGVFGDYEGTDYYVKKSDAIAVVKQGGVSDNVCEWKKSKDYPFDWLVGCDGCEVNHRQGDYCPICGKKIKIVGD